ncbi:MAG: DUF1559 domain-containing protein, partial [Planctomycetota bacterium]
MRYTHGMIPTIVLALILYSTSAVRATDDRESLTRMADNDTVALVIVDFDLSDQHRELIAGFTSEMVRSGMGKLKALGVEECALLGSMQLPDSRIILTDPGEATVESVAQEFPELTVEMAGGFITLGYPVPPRNDVQREDAFDAFEAENAVEIQQLLKSAIAAVETDNHKIKIAIIAGPDQRRVMADVMPPMLTAFQNSTGVELPEIDPAEMSRNFRWMSIAMLPEDGGANLIEVKTRLETEESTRALAGLVPHFGDVMNALDSSGGLARITENLQFNAVVDGNELTITSPNRGFERILERGTLEARSNDTLNRARQFAIAMHNSYDANRHFPAIGSRSEDGEPLLSWRVHILPYIEQGELYQQFHLDEPWDSPHNLTLIDKMPAIYQAPGSSNDRSSGLSNCRRPNGNGAMFRDYTPIEFKDITDGTSNPVMIVEVD